MTYANLSFSMSRVINGIASFLSTSRGFAITFAALLVGIGIGGMVQFNEVFMFGFNIFLSVAAIVISGVILVSAARSEAAIHVKLDYLIEYSKASNKSVGLEHKGRHEIEAARKAVEKEALKDLEGVVDEEVDERLDERDGAKRATSAPAE